jgi:RNA polymerase sigma-70 factor (ECF subfamily)
MQDAFVLAYRKLSHFRHDASFKTWLLTIAWRRAIRLRQSPSRRVGRLVSLDQEGRNDVAERRATAEDRLVADEIHRDVARLIRTLPSRLREPLLLAASGNYSYGDLSDILGIPTGTIKWRVSEARRLLRSKLQRLGHGYKK